MRLHWLFGFAVLGTLAACGSAGSNALGGGTGGGGTGGGGLGGMGAGGAGLPLDGGYATDGDVSSSDCSDAARLVYVVTEQYSLYSFKPNLVGSANAFAQIGQLSCPAGGATPFSMAVQRDGTAWVVYSDGSLWNVSTTNASCKSTAFVPGQQGFTTFGMGFATDGATGSSETLYIASASGGGKLGKIDLNTLTVTAIGSFPQEAELTGTGDGRLFGFFTNPSGNGTVVAEANKQTGALLNQAPQPNVTLGSGWAFAFWGGSFWLFTAPLLSSQIDQYDTTNGTTKTVAQNLPQIIVGAGVSTCAPIAPPN